MPMYRSAAAPGVRSIGRSAAGGLRAAAVEQDIAITYVNNTGIDDPEFSVVVFTKDQNTANINYKTVAWKVRKGLDIFASSCTIFCCLELWMQLLYPPHSFFLKQKDFKPGAFPYASGNPEALSAKRKRALQRLFFSGKVCVFRK